MKTKDKLKFQKVTCVVHSQLKFTRWRVYI